LGRQPIANVAILRLFDAGEGATSARPIRVS